MWNDPAQWAPLTSLQDYFSLIPTESVYGFLLNVGFESNQILL